MNKRPYRLFYAGHGDWHMVIKSSYSTEQKAITAANKLLGERLGFSTVIHVTVMHESGKLCFDKSLTL
jgi:hypothetical protein